MHLLDMKKCVITLGFMMNYYVRVFMYRFFISRAMVIMHESLRMIFMMTLQCTDACTDGVLKYIDVVLIYL